MQYEFEVMVDPSITELNEHGAKGWHCVGVTREEFATTGWEEKATKEMAKQGFYATPPRETKTVFYMEREKPYLAERYNSDAFKPAP